MSFVSCDFRGIFILTITDITLNSSVLLLAIWEVVIIILPVRVVHLKVLTLTTLLLKNMCLRETLAQYTMNAFLEILNSNGLQSKLRSPLMCCGKYVGMKNVLIVEHLNRIGHP